MTNVRTMAVLENMAQHLDEEELHDICMYMTNDRVFCAQLYRGEI